MAELLRRVSLVVLMSEFETHPLVALEAAAAGRRLLVAEAGGLAEIAEDGFARAIPLDDSAGADRPRPRSRSWARRCHGNRPQLTSWDECADGARGPLPIDT